MSVLGIKIIKPCFCGGTEISVKKRAYNEGMDGYSNDWVFHCNKCGCDINYPADGFYGRDYYKTIEDAIVKWNKDHEKAFPPKKDDKAFHCGVEESGGHAYNCNDCTNKCEEWYQWDKEMKE